MMDAPNSRKRPKHWYLHPRNLGAKNDGWKKTTSFCEGLFSMAMLNFRGVYS